MTDAVKFKYSEILNAVQSLQSLLEADVPVQTSIRIVKLANTVNKATEDFNTLQKQFAENCAVLDEDGNKKMTENGDWEKTPDYVVKMNELFASEIAYDITPIQESELGTKATMKSSILFSLSQLKLVILN